MSPLAAWSDKALNRLKKILILGHVVRCAISVKFFDTAG
jgi:hypothetical protein